MHDFQWRVSWTCAYHAFVGVLDRTQCVSSESTQSLGPYEALGKIRLMTLAVPCRWIRSFRDEENPIPQHDRVWVAFT